MPTHSVSLDQIRGYMVDLDGTVYLGDRLLPGALEFYTTVRRQGKRVLFLTNNSSKGPREYCEKLRALGIPVADDEIYTSAEATLAYLNTSGCRTLYPLATASFRKLMTDAGYTLTADNPDCVVLGYDTELTYDKLRTACRLLLNGVRFVASHPDIVCPTAEGPVPDAGSMLLMIEAATGRTPEVIVGKPNPLMLDLALARLGVERCEAAMIGDRLDTDMAMAANAGATSILVFTGEATPEAADASHHRLDYRFQSIADIAQVLNNTTG